MQHLFEGGIHLKIVLIMVLLFSILTSFDFDYWAMTLIPGLHWVTFFSQIQHLIGSSAYLSKHGIIIETVFYLDERGDGEWKDTWKETLAVNHNLP